MQSNGCKEKSLENTLRKAYNWLKYMDLLPKNFSQLNRAQVGKLAAKIGQFCVVDNRDLFSIFSDCMASTYNRLNVLYGTVQLFNEPYLLCRKWFSRAGIRRAIKLLPCSYWICFANMIFKISYFVTFNEINSSSIFHTFFYFNSRLF